MPRRRRSLLRSFHWLLIGLVAISELAIFQWLRLLRDRPLEWGEAGMTLAVLLGLNTAWLLVTRRAPGLRRSLVFGRIFLAASLGALGCGLMLAAAWSGVGLLSAFTSQPAQTFMHWGALAGGVALVFAAAVLSYSLSFGQKRVVVGTVHVGMPELPRPLHGLRIAHITDLHIGPNLRARQLRALVERVNATEPDLIAITGDIFDFDPSYIEEGCRELAKLQAPHGCYAILGNHDLYTGAQRVAEGLEQLTSICVLRDAWTRIQIGAEPFYVLGLEDPGVGLADRGIRSAALERLVREIPPDAPRLLLVHRPNYLPQIADLKLPVALAGHTHGGQISLPRPIHHHNVARLTTPWTRGLFELGETQLYVNRGLGVSGVKARLNCPREIALITLAPRQV
jgi:predicted MPP superfamily phosphohydrolase